MRKSLLRFFVLFLFSLTMFGCGFFESKTVRIYEGPVRPNSEISVLNTRLGLPYFWVSIDGVPKGKLNPYKKFLELLPGEHEMVIMGSRWSDGVTTTILRGVWSLKVNMKAGHTYRLFHQKSGQNAYPYIIDTQTNEKYWAGGTPASIIK